MTDRNTYPAYCTSTSGSISAVSPTFERNKQDYADDEVGIIVNSLQINYDDDVNGDADEPTNLGQAGSGGVRGGERH